MNKILDPIKNLTARFRKPKDASSAPRPKPDRFTLISWGVTWLIVLGALGFALWRTQGVSAAIVALPTSAPDASQPNVTLPTQGAADGATSVIDRLLQLKTNRPDRGRFDAIPYQVVSGDAVFSIAKQFSLKPETILYTNKDTLNDNPYNLKPGMVLTIPPMDGLEYTWKEGDTIESVADQFKAKPEDIINFPGNNLDLTDPQIKPGQVVMIPGGIRELTAWTEFIPTIDRSSGSATSELGGNGCSLGPIGMPGLWPTNGPHTISGNDYGPNHLGIDITAVYVPVLASGAGVVVFAGWSQYGYGQVVQIDHGNGYATIYAHLSQINVQVCEAVNGGQVIGISGSTGNSTGPHLHFEVRQNGANLNPWFILQ